MVLVTTNISTPSASPSPSHHLAKHKPLNFMKLTCPKPSTMFSLSGFVYPSSYSDWVIKLSWPHHKAFIAVSLCGLCLTC